MAPPRGATARGDLAAAIDRIALGYRVVAAAWLAVLAVVAARAGHAPVAVAVAAAGIAAAWTGLTIALEAGRPGALRSWRWLVADVAVAGGVVVGPALAGVELSVGGYPFAAVVWAARVRGRAGGLLAAGGLAAATLARLAAVEGAMAQARIVETVVFYVVGAGVLAWAIGVLERSDAERRMAEAALSAERAARIRAAEREETAAHLHDSVLQTLALIQRRNEDPVAVTTLARSSERDLRRWLAGDARPSPTGFAEALAGAAAELEQRHGVAVELVTVGDGACTPPLAALVDATREALVNAAKHAGVDRIWVFAERDEAGTTVFVRDRGVGFDPAAVPADRQGLRRSVHGRLARIGGTATVRSAPGAGTEVELVVPRAAEHVGTAAPGPAGAEGAR